MSTKFLTNNQFLETNVSNISIAGLETIKDYVFSILLNSSNKIKSVYADSIGIVDVFQVANAAARLALSASEGDIAIQNDDGSTWIYGSDDTWIQSVYPRLLASLTDTLISFPSDAQYLTYDGDNNRWYNRVLEIDRCNDVDYDGIPLEGQILRMTSYGVWTNQSIDLKTNLNSLDDVVITTPSNGQLLQYNGTNFVNATLPYTTTTSFSNHVNDAAIHRSIGAPTAGHIPLGNGLSFDSVWPDLYLMSDVNISTPVNGNKLIYTDGEWVNTSVDTWIQVTTNRAITLTDSCKNLFSMENTDITLTLGNLLLPQGAHIKFKNFNTTKRFKILPSQDVIINGRWQEINIGKYGMLYAVDSNQYVFDGDFNENLLYAGITTAPIINYVIDTAYKINHTSSTTGLISYSFTTGSTKRYNTYNAESNVTTYQTVATSNYPFGTNILNINDTDYYSFEFSLAANSIRIIHTDNKFLNYTDNILLTDVMVCSSRCIYDTVTNKIVVPYVKTDNNLRLLSVSTDLITFTTIDTVITLANAVKVFCGWHIGYGLVMCQYDTGSVVIKINNSTTSFMNDTSRPVISLAPTETVEECRDSDASKNGIFLFLTYTSTTYSLWAVNDTMTDVYKLITFTQKSELLRQPAVIRNDILYLIAHTQPTAGINVAQLIIYNISTFDVKRNTNLFGNNYIGFLSRTLSGVQALGFVYNTTGAHRYVKHAIAG